MVKLTQTIRGLLPTNCSSVLDHFFGLVLKGLITNRRLILTDNIMTVFYIITVFIVKFQIHFFKSFFVSVSTYCTYLPHTKFTYNPAGIHLLKVNNRNTRARCEMCSKLTVIRSGVFIVNFEHISHIVAVFLLSSLSR